MSERYDEQADAAERELAEMEKRTDQVGEQIDDTRKDWDAKVADPGVPGAVGEAGSGEEGGPAPETAYPGKGSSDELSGKDED